jgi:hypothetical protein
MVSQCLARWYEMRIVDSQFWLEPDNAPDWLFGRPRPKLSCKNGWLKNMILKQAIFVLLQVKIWQYTGLKWVSLVQFERQISGLKAIPADIIKNPVLGFNT